METISGGKESDEDTDGAAGAGAEVVVVDSDVAEVVFAAGGVLVEDDSVEAVGAVVAAVVDAGAEGVSFGA